VDRSRIGKKSFWEKHIAPKLGGMKDSFSKSEGSYKLSHFLQKFSEDDTAHRHDGATHWAHVFAHNDKKPVGEAVYLVDDKGLRHAGSNITPTYAEPGHGKDHISQILHRHAEKVTGKKLYFKKSSIEKIEILQCLQSFYKHSLRKNFQLTKNETLDSILEQRITKSYQGVLRFVAELQTSDLKKAVKKGDWARIERSHRGEHSDTVDHSYHLDNHPSYDSYKNFLNNPEEQPAFKDVTNGISAKMTHQAPNAFGQPELVMGKPYHKNPESATKSWIKDPILGWATITTRGIYSKAGIDHLCEDVGTHQHKGIPLTVHRFEPGVTNISDNISSIRNGSKKVNPMHWKQIGVMDFLMNNLDRHNQNLMIQDNPDENGTHGLFAIDHERNFQYHKNPSDMWWGGRDNAVVGDAKPSHFINTRANEYIRDQFKDWDKNDHTPFDNKLAEWWIDKRHKIKAELESHLSAIKDEHVRKHIRDNFHHRWDTMNDWAEDAHRFGAENLESPHDPNFYGSAKLIPSGRPRNPRIDSIINRLPMDRPADAIHSLINNVRQRKTFTPRQQELVSQAIDTIISKMDTDDVIRLINRTNHDPLYRHKHIEPMNVWIKGIKHIAEHGDRTAKNKFLKYVENLPKGSQQKGRLNFWANFIKDRMG